VFQTMIDNASLRRAFACFPSGVAAVCTEVDGTPVGVAASSFTTVSIQPPLVSVNMRHASTTWPLLRTGRRLGLSVLAEGQETICRQLAGHVDSRFADVEWLSTSEGSVSICREHASNVKRWRDGQMALRWCAAGMVEAGKQFRRVNGHLHLRSLRDTLERITQPVDATRHDGDVQAA
jgi:Flavin reductase like domain